MDNDWLIRVILLIILILFSALFSGSEVALFSLSQKDVKEFLRTNKIVGKYILNLLEYPRRLLVNILLGNTIVNVSASIIAVSIALDAAKILNLSVGFVLTIQIVLLTTIILLFGELTPKIWATKKPLQFAKVVAVPLYWIGIIFYPISKILTDSLRLLVSKINFDKSKTAIKIMELPELADLGVERGTIKKGEHELIHGLVEFKTVSVREVMTPRVDITAVPVNASFDEVMNAIVKSGHSRIPLYQDNLDKIIGVIYAKDLLPFLKNDILRKNFSTLKIYRETLFVPETKLISNLLHEFQQKNMHIGIVVDEYGGTSGLVSMEDILEEIIGEIRDEYDKDEKEIYKIDDDNYIVVGKVGIEQLNELLNSNFSSENDDYDTVAGFIYYHAGNIPHVGYQFDYNGYKFTVKEVVGKRIKKIQIEKVKLE
ncbi:hemolysin family protein [Melioribacteraceae bacterium 4301-Me]|uniref:hemolysin family protein n=1 Tax=Pyranulibacter aquaticus TaxID=3163344 RepID=UPI00359A1C3E